MNTNLITIAIRRREQADYLVEKLKINGIEATIHPISQNKETIGDGVRVRISECDLIKALAVIEQIEEYYTDESHKDRQVPQILVPVDFSKRSINACQIAFKLASIIKAEVQIIHAYYLSTALYDISASPMHENELYSCAQKISVQLSNLEKEINHNIETQHWESVPFALKSGEGLPEDVILNYCHKNRPNLVLMSTRSIKQKERDLTGSVTSEVAENCNCPILIIPDEAPFPLEDKNINILFATNFDQRTLNTLERLMMLFKELHFNLFISHFSESNDSWDEIKLMGIKQYIATHYPKISCEYHIISGDNLLSELSSQINNLSIDLCVVNVHKRNLLAKLFNPSIARKMISQSQIPILVFHS